MGGNETVRRWVDEAARLCRPDDVVWCDGSADERDRLTAAAVRAGELLPLDQRKLPGCYLHRSAPNDVARTEHLTYICSPEKDEAGPTNNWMAPAEALRPAREDLPELHGRADDVRHPVPHGAARLAVRPGRGPGDGQPLRRPQHADHDAHGTGRARPPGRVGRLHARAPLHGGPRRRPPLHLPLPRGPHDLERGLGLRRQRPPLQEVHGAPDRERHRARAKAGSPSTC